MQAVSSMGCLANRDLQQGCFRPGWFTLQRESVSFTRVRDVISRTACHSGITAANSAT